MNRRIEELVNEARQYATSDTNMGGKHMSLDVFHEKFAELIVQECAGVVTLWSNEEPCSEGYDIFTVCKIKEHFGIKES